MIYTMWNYKCWSAVTYFVQSAMKKNFERKLKFKKIVITWNAHKRGAKWNQQLMKLGTSLHLSYLPSIVNANKIKSYLKIKIGSFAQLVIVIRFWKRRTLTRIQEEWNARNVNYLIAQIVCNQVTVNRLAIKLKFRPVISKVLLVECMKIFNNVLNVCQCLKSQGKRLKWNVKFVDLNGVGCVVTTLILLFMIVCIFLANFKIMHCLATCQYSLSVSIYFFS